MSEGGGRWQSLLILLVFVSLAVTPIAGAVAESAEASTPALTVQSGVTFEKNVMVGQQGGVAFVTVNVPEGGEATISILRDDPRYEAHIPVKDGSDGDSTVTLRINTYHVGDNSTGYEVVTERDAVTPDSIVGPSYTSYIKQTDIRKWLPTGDFSLEVRQGTEPDGSPADVATLSLTEADSPMLELWRAPSSADISSYPEIISSFREGRLTESATVAHGDQLVVRIRRAAVMNGILTSESSNDEIYTHPNAEGPFLEAIQEESPDLRFAIPPTGSGGTSQPLQDQLTTANTDVVLDYKNDTGYIIIDTSQLDLSREGTTQEYDITVELSKGDVPPGSEGQSSEALRLTPAAVSIERFDQESGDGWTIGGFTTVAPGSELTLAVEAPSGTTRRASMVKTDARFGASFQLPQVEAGDVVNLTVYTSSGASLSGQVIAGSAESTTLTASPEETPDSTVAETAAPGESTATPVERSQASQNEDSNPPVQPRDVGAASMLDAITTHFAFSVLVFVVSISIGGAVYVYWIR